MQSRYLVSIVVPVYNNFENIKTCMHSLMAQTYSEIEVLFIDDGSLNELPQELRNEISCNPNFTFHKKNHEGPGAARNFGIQQAKGDYLLFMDSDDDLDKDAIQHMITAIEDSNERIDLLMFGFHLYHGNQFIEDKTAPRFEGKQEIFIGQPFYEAYTKFLINAPWNKLIRREFLIKREILFDTSLFILEDLLFSIDVIEKSEKIINLDQAYYHYYYSRPGSLTARFNLGKEEIIFRVADRLTELTKDHPEYQGFYCKDAVMKIILQLIEIRKQSQYSVREKIDIITKILRRKELKQLTQEAVPDNPKEKKKIRILKTALIFAGN